LRVHSIPLSMSLIKILNTIGPNTDPRGAPLVTDLHSEITDIPWTLISFWTNIIIDIDVIIKINKY